jgi:branched-chain amino acid transport system ATP-binding protein
MTALLQVDSLSVRYRSGAVGVSDVSLEVEAGQVVALFGPNGAGKTTTARAISGFMKTEGVAVAGVVRLEDHEITRAEPHSIAGLGVTLVPETSKTFMNLTVAENLLAIGKLPPGGRRTVFSIVAAVFPELVSRSSELAGRLSGGQQQMLAIARALATQPRLIVIDEMSLGLHPEVRSRLFMTVRDIARGGAGVLLIEESVAAALEIADQCYILRSGRIRDHGPAAKYVGNELVAAGYLEPGTDDI